MTSTVVARANDSSNTMHACVGSAGQVRIVDDPAECRNIEGGASWNKMGPQGPKGDPGLPGPKGDKGDQGDRGQPGPSEAVVASPSFTSFGSGFVSLATLTLPTTNEYVVLGPVAAGTSNIGRLDVIAATNRPSSVTPIVVPPTGGASGEIVVPAVALPAQVFPVSGRREDQLQRAFWPGEARCPDGVASYLAARTTWILPGACVIDFMPIQTRCEGRSSQGTDRLLAIRQMCLVRQGGVALRPFVGQGCVAGSRPAKNCVSSGEPFFCGRPTEV